MQPRKICLTKRLDRNMISLKSKKIIARSRNRLTSTYWDEERYSRHLSGNFDDIVDECSIGI